MIENNLIISKKLMLTNKLIISGKTHEYRLIYSFRKIDY